VERLVPGENNAIYKVTYRGSQGDANHVVVRVGSRGVAAQLRAKREAMVLRKVGGVAGPKLYDFRAEVSGLDGPVMCLEFIQGHDADLSEVALGGLERLGRLVRWLHAQPVEDFGGWIPAGMGLSAYVQERWQDHLAARLGAIRDPLPALLQKRLRAAVAVVSGAVEELKRLAAVASDDRLVLLHGDISGTNLLWVPEPVLIDWEYARLGDPADEVAYVFTQNALTDLQQDAFWRGYSEPLAPASDLTERVQYWKPITLLGSILWWLDAWSHAEAATRDGPPAMSLRSRPDYYLEQASDRLERFQ
jgi:aminoglycoside phosphotransferase (APT) family kinase protein